MILSFYEEFVSDSIRNLIMVVAIGNMPKKVYQYRMFCETEGTHVYVWGDKKPTACPNVNTHTVTANSITVVRRVAENNVSIIEEEPEVGNKPTGGHFAARTISLSIPANETITESISWPFPISVFAISYISAQNQYGDVVNVYIARETTVGALTANAAVGATVLNVSPTVLAHVKVGFEITIDDGVNKNVLGRLFDIDEAAGQITVETATTHEFAAATPTYVKMSIHMLQGHVFASGGSVAIGESKLGGSYLPANTPVTIVYQNNSSEDKLFVPFVEYLY